MMAWSRTSLLCAVAAALFVGHAFVVPTPGQFATPNRPPTAALAASAAQPSGSSSARDWSIAAGTIAIGAHVGLLVASRARGNTARAAEAEAEAPAKKVAKKKEAGPPLISAKDERLFEMVFHSYTREYLKGPMFWSDNKLVGSEYVAEPGAPEIRNGKRTLQGRFKNFSSNELAALSLLFFGIGLWGMLMFNYVDNQWEALERGEYFNPSYIAAAQFLLPSWFLHLMCYTQKKNGK